MAVQPSEGSLFYMRVLFAIKLYAVYVILAMLKVLKKYVPVLHVFSMSSGEDVVF